MNVEGKRIADTQRRARALLHLVYNIYGPRGPKCRSLPYPIFAKMTPAEVNKHYDFNGRHLMQKIAKNLVALDEIPEVRQAKIRR